MLVELDDVQSQNHDIIRALQDELVREYYHSEDFHIETAFEQALQKANELLHRAIPDNLDEWLSSLNIVIAVLKDTTLHFTVVGRMHAFMVHRQRIIDVLDSSSGGVEPPSSMKIFTSIVSGQLNLNDSLLFCTTSILDHLSQEKLKRMMVNHSSDETAAELERILSETQAETAFGALVVRLSAVQEHEREPERFAAVQNVERIRQPQDSMATLIEREQATNSLLNHSMWLNLGRITKKVANTVRTPKRDESETPEDTELTSDLIVDENVELSVDQPPSKTVPHFADTKAKPSFVKAAKPFAKAAGKAGLQGFSALVGGASAGFRKLASARPKRSARNIPAATNKGIARGANWFTHLTVMRRRLLLAAVVLILLFSQSVVSLGKQREKQVEIDRYNSFISTAKERVEAADAALLIDNESGARRLLNEAAEFLDQVPASQKKLLDEADTVRTSIAERLSTIRHALGVNLEQVVDLSGVEVGFETASIGAVGGTLYTFNTRNDSVYSIAPAEKKVDIVVDAPSLSTHLTRFIPGRDGTLMIQQNDTSLQEVRLSDGAISSVSIDYQNADRSVRDMFFYNNRLYTLDSKNNQIFRHDRSGAAYRSGTAWITSPDVDIKDGVSIAIDGSLYVLKQNGEIVKLTGGKQDATSFDTVDPALTSPTILYTNSDLANLYVLEPSTKRIVEYAKDGGFLRQYEAAALEQATDIVVIDGTVYVLAGTQILQFALQTE